MKLKTILSFYTIIFSLKLKELHANTNCSIQNSTMNSSSTPGTLSMACFNISVSSVNEIIIHANEKNVLGISFKFINNASSSYVENSANIQNFSIKLSTNELRGVGVSAETGINSLKFLLYDTVSKTYNWTALYGNNNSSVSALNSDSMNSNYSQINTISGCIDCNDSVSLIYLSFAYSFNQCPNTSTDSSTTLISSSTIDTNTMITSSKKNTTRVAMNTTTIEMNTTEAAINTTTLINQTTTKGPVWNEWNPWYLCVMIRNRIVNDTSNERVITQKQEINVSCTLIFTQAEQIVQVLKIKNETTVALNNILNETHSNIQAVAETYKAQIRSVEYLSTVAIVVCCLLVFSIMSFDIPRILNSELFKEFINIMWKRILNWFDKKNNKENSNNQLENETQKENENRDYLEEPSEEPENEKSNNIFSVNSCLTESVYFSRNNSSIICDRFQNCTPDDEQNLNIENQIFISTSEASYDSKHKSKLTKWDLNLNEFSSIKAASIRLEYLVDQTMPSLGPQQREIFLKEKLLKTFSKESQSKLKNIMNKGWNEFVQDIECMHKNPLDFKFNSSNCIYH